MNFRLSLLNNKFMIFLVIIGYFESKTAIFTSMNIYSPSKKVT